MAKDFAGCARKVIKEFNYKGPFPKRKYARFRIEVSLNKTLCTGFYLDLEEGDSIWFDFKYERIHYCSKCRDLGHDSTCCKEMKEALLFPLRNNYHFNRCTSRLERNQWRK